MNFAIVLIGILLLALVLERLWLYFVVRKRGARPLFSEFYVFAMYKPLLILLAFAAYAASLDADLFLIGLFIAMAIASVAITYPVTRVVYSRRWPPQDRSDDRATD